MATRSHAGTHGREPASVTTEFLWVVDRNNNPIGKATRKEVHERGDWHRGAHILVFNSKGELLLPKRAKDRPQQPDKYDCSASGHVVYGDSYEETIEREAEEELGIKTDKRPELMLKFRLIYGPNDKNISALFVLRGYDGPITIQKAEVQSAEFVPMEKVKEMLLKDEDQFTTWMAEILAWYFHLPSALEQVE